MTIRRLPEHFWKDLKSRREREIIRYLDGFSDSSLRAWREGTEDLPKDEVCELVKLIFDQRRARRVTVLDQNGEYPEPETGERVKLR